MREEKTIERGGMDLRFFHRFLYGFIFGGRQGCLPTFKPLIKSVADFRCRNPVNFPSMIPQQLVSSFILLPLSRFVMLHAVNFNHPFDVTNLNNKVNAALLKFSGIPINKVPYKNLAVKFRTESAAEFSPEPIKKNIFFLAGQISKFKRQCRRDDFVTVTIRQGQQIFCCPKKISHCTWNIQGG